MLNSIIFWVRSQDQFPQSLEANFEGGHEPPLEDKSPYSPENEGGSMEQSIDSVYMEGR